MNKLLELILTIVPLLLAVLWYVARRNSATVTPQRGALPNPTEAVLFGSRLIADGVHYFTDWSAAMRREFVGDIDEHLNDWYQLSKDVSRLPVGEWRTTVSKRLGGV